MGCPDDINVPAPIGGDPQRLSTVGANQMLVALQWLLAGNYGSLDASAITADQRWQLPDKSGIVALLDDLAGAGGLSFTATNTSGSTIQAGQPVASDGAGGIVLAQGDADTTLAVGVAYEQIAAAATGRVVTMGVVTRSDWTVVTGTVALVAYADYFLSVGGAGILTTVAPDATGDRCQIVGHYLSATQLLVRIAEALYT